MHRTSELRFKDVNFKSCSSLKLFTSLRSQTPHKSQSEALSQKHLRTTGIERDLGVVNNGLVYGVVASGMEEEDGGKLLQYSVNDCLVVLERDDTVGGGGGEERRYGGGGREEEKGGGDTKNGWWLCLLEGTHGFVLCEHLAVSSSIVFVVNVYIVEIS